MNKKSRTYNAIKNSSVGIALQVITVILNFVVRTIFVQTLCKEYLGVNGLFSNIFTMLSVAEMGIGGAIIYCMYKPVAEADERRIAQLMHFYRWAYRLVGGFVLITGGLLTPFLRFIIDDIPDIPHIYVIYLLYVVNSGLSYFFTYKRSLVIADQKEYISHYVRLFFTVLKAVGQGLILLVWKDFILYLLVQTLVTVLDNIVISLYVDKHYSFLKRFSKESLDVQERKSIFSNIKALFIYKIGSRVLDGTDNILISKFVGISWVGLLSNYTLITSAISMVTSQILSAMTAGVGNYIAKEHSNSYEKLVQRISFLNYVIYGYVFLMLTTLFNPFIECWIGAKYLVSYQTVVVIALNEYIYGMMNSIWTFRSTMGLFTYGRWRPMISAIINIVVSILLALKLGMIGVLIGTTITRLSTNVWYDPLIVYRYGLRKSPMKFYLSLALYTMVMTLDLIGVSIIYHYLPIMHPFVNLVVRAVLTSLVFGGTLVLVWRKSDEFRYLIDRLKLFFRRKI